MVDVFGEDSDSQEELEKEKPIVQQQQQPVVQHSKTEKVKKNSNEEAEIKKKPDVGKTSFVASTKLQPILFKKESAKLNKNESIAVEKKVIDRKRKPLEIESSISAKKKFDKKEEIKRASNESHPSKLQNQTSNLNEQLIESKEKVLNFNLERSIFF